MHAQVRAAAPDFDCLAVEMRAGRGTEEGMDGGGMLGSGMLLVQPPYGIEAQLAEVLPALGAALGQEQRVVHL